MSMPPNKAHLDKDDDGIASEDIKDFAYCQLDFSQLPIEEIKHLASYASIKDTPHWHTGLAWILMEGGYNTTAIRHFKEALTMAPDAWLPKEGLARVYGSQGLYTDAIRLMQDACESVPQNFEHLSGYLLP